LVPCAEGFTVVMGHRRCQAFRMLAERHPEQYTHIPAIVAQAMDDKEIREIQLIENIQRENLSARDVADTLRWFRENGYTLQEIARRLGKSLGYVKNMSSAIKAMDAEPYLAGLVQYSGSITLTDLQEVTGVPIRPRMHLLKLRASGALRTVRELRQAVADWKAGLPIDPSRQRAHGADETVPAGADDWFSSSQPQAEAGAQDTASLPPGKRPRKTRALASCIRLEEDSIVFLPVLIIPSTLAPEQKTELRSLLEAALARIGD